VVGLSALVAIFNVAYNSSGVSSGVAFMEQIDDIESQFVRYIFESGRNYHTREEFLHRLQIYTHNFKKVQEINSKNSGLYLELNMFADLSDEEFRSFLSYRSHTFLPEAPASTEEPLGLNLPEEVDWREKNAVNPVKN